MAARRMTMKEVLSENAILRGANEELRRKLELATDEISRKETVINNVTRFKEKYKAQRNALYAVQSGRIPHELMREHAKRYCEQFGVASCTPGQVAAWLAGQE